MHDGHPTFSYDTCDDSQQTELTKNSPEAGVGLSGSTSSPCHARPYLTCDPRVLSTDYLNMLATEPPWVHFFLLSPHPETIYPNPF